MSALHILDIFLFLRLTSNLFPVSSIQGKIGDEVYLIEAACAEMRSQTKSGPFDGDLRQFPLLEVAVPEI